MSYLGNLILFFGGVTTCLSINRPVYKIVLAQKGYAQFLQYDIDTPPLKEFTFCTWFRIYDLNGDQTIFTYVTSGNNRVIRVWLDSGGRHMSVSFDQKAMSVTPVEISKDVWRHLCLSYQADYGAWALYLDSRLISCQSSQTLYGAVLPGSGSVIVGYGTDGNGRQNGLEGEIFGVNMILMSTIAKNYTTRENPLYKQKSFRQNKLKDEEQRLKYVILGDLQTGEVNNNFEATEVPKVRSKATQSFIRVRTPHSLVEHDVGSDLTRDSISFNDNNFFDFSGTTKNSQGGNSNIQNINTKLNTAEYELNKKSKTNIHAFQKELPTLKEYEVPPPTYAYNIYDNNLPQKNNNENKVEPGKPLFDNKYAKDQICDMEMPPTIDMNTKVYGQWSSTKFAGNVLSYLKSKNLRPRENRKVVPATIPLNKISDSFPYASDFKVFKVRPGAEFQRKKLVQKQQFDNKRMPQINLQIEDDLRSNILKYHAQAAPKNVEITNRGVVKKRQDHRFYRNIDNQKESGESYETDDSEYRPKLHKPRKKPYSAETSSQNVNLMTIHPFLKSLEYFTGDKQDAAPHSNTKDPDVYTRSLSQANKWHNVKSYSNDFTPREIRIGLEDSQRNMDEKIAEVNRKHPSLLLKYQHHDRRHHRESESIQKGRKMALAITNHSDFNKDSVSILKYNNGFLDKPKNNGERNIRIIANPSKKFDKNSFHTPVKIGNALNERPVIGDNEEQNKKSFVGGDERVPDINKYKSEREKESIQQFSIPVGVQICKNLELYNDVLYVQPDGSIDKTHFLSPLKMRNVAVEFIIQNYKLCSLQDSNWQNNAMLYINWSKTPVRLFGGAIPRKTTDLCGFF